MNIDNLILTTRIRLARNIADVPFAIRDQAFFENIAEKIVVHDHNLMIFKLAELPERDSLFEQHLISADFLENSDNGVLVIHKNNRVSIMLGEEDHIRIQAINNKFDLFNTYQTAKHIADQLDKDCDIARDPVLGYLTKCPTNLGGGLRASVMIYLPALTMTKQITKVFNDLDNQKITIRGIYGENSDSSGCIYQISNQNCIFMSDQEVLSMINKVVGQIVAVELNLERELWQNSPDKIIDKVMRAWGLLTNAHLLTSQETREQLAWIKLGSGLKIFSFRNEHILDELFFLIQPATLKSNYKSPNADQTTCDKLRARTVREKLLLFRTK